MVQVKKDNTDNSDIPSFVVLMSEMIYSRHVYLILSTEDEHPPWRHAPISLLYQGGYEVRGRRDRDYHQREM